MQPIYRVVIMCSRFFRRNIFIRKINTRKFSINKDLKKKKDNDQNNSRLEKLKEELKNLQEPSDIPHSKNIRGFIEFKRKQEPFRLPSERVQDWEEVFTEGHSDIHEIKRQAARCMDCGTPFCQSNSGCPLSNLIPEWNELVVESQWDEALDRLHKTNNFPEFTGRVCPAPCETACVAGIIDEPVTIKNIEYAIIDRGFKDGKVKPKPIRDSDRSGKKVVIVGSGPAGLAAADCLNQLGHKVKVLERDDNIGGLLYYGIPNPKLDKRTIKRRVDLLRAEGIEFQTNANVGYDIHPSDLLNNYDAVLLAIGSTVPRSLDCPGSDLKGIHYAMDFLSSNQKDLQVNNEGCFKNQWSDELISAKGKHVVVIGGGDTGTDCISTSIRQYCKSITNIEISSKKPATRNQVSNPWPQFLRTHKIDYGHAESIEIFGADPRKFSVFTKSIIGDKEKNVKSIMLARLEKASDGTFVESFGTEEQIPCDLLLLAMGYTGPDQIIIDKFHLDVDEKGNIQAEYNDFSTKHPKVFAAGDCRKGASLVVHAINEGRRAAAYVDSFLSSDQKKSSYFLVNT